MRLHLNIDTRVELGHQHGRQVQWKPKALEKDKVETLAPLIPCGNFGRTELWPDSGIDL